MKCSKCGNEMNPGNKYCPNCGNQISNNTLAIISVVLGVLSMTIGIVFLPIGVIGLILACVQKDKTSLRTTGIVLNIIGIVFCVLFWLFFGFLAVNIKNSLFEGTFLDTLVEKTKNTVNFSTTQNDWEAYESIRKELPHGKEKTLIGTWRMLSDDNTYTEIKDGTMCSFIGLEEREDEECGTYKLANIIDENDIVNKYTDMFKKIIENNGIYLMKLTFVNEDKEEENISLMWILIDHKEEGIEAVVVNNTEEEDGDEITSSFMKIAD